MWKSFSTTSYKYASGLVFAYYYTINTNRGHENELPLCIVWYAKSKSQANSLITNRLSAVSENRLPSRDMKAFPLFRENYSLAH